MKQSHYLIACACVVSLGIGYVAGGIRASSASEKKQTANPRQMKSASRDRQSRESSGDELLAGILKGRSARDLSDGELVKIMLQLSKYDATQSPVSAARRSYQLQLLLAKLPVSRLEQAAKIYREGLLDGTFNQSTGLQTSMAISHALARLGTKALLNFMDSLPHRQQENVLLNCCRGLPESDRGEMISEIYQRAKDGRMSPIGFEIVLTRPLLTDHAQAEVWLAKMEPGKERASLELSAARQFLRNGDTDAAREWMTSAIARYQGREKELLKGAIDKMAYNNPEDIPLFVSLMPQGVEITAKDLQYQANVNSSRGFSGLTGIAAAISDPAEQTKLITTALEQFTSYTQRNMQTLRLNAVDFEILNRQLQTLNLTGENATKVAEALAAAQSATPKSRE